MHKEDTQWSISDGPHMWGIWPGSSILSYIYVTIHSWKHTMQQFTWHSRKQNVAIERPSLQNGKQNLQLYYNGKPPCSHWYNYLGMYCIIILSSFAYFHNWYGRLILSTSLESEPNLRTSFRQLCVSYNIMHLSGQVNEPCSILIYRTHCPAVYTWTTVLHLLWTVPM